MMRLENQKWHIARRKERKGLVNKRIDKRSTRQEQEIYLIKINTENMEAFNIDNMTGRNSTGVRPNDPLKHLAVSSIIGDNIINSQGESLGRIKDIMIDLSENKIEYVVIEFGGFLGMNQKYLRYLCKR